MDTLWHKFLKAPRASQIIFVLVLLAIAAWGGEGIVWSVFHPIFLLLMGVALSLIIGAEAASYVYHSGGILLTLLFVGALLVLGVRDWYDLLPIGDPIWRWIGAVMIAVVFATSAFFAFLQWPDWLPKPRTTASLDDDSEE